MDSEAEFSFTSGPCNANSYYYVQSPSPISHGLLPPTHHHSPQNSSGTELEVINRTSFQLPLSRCSSSRASISCSSFFHDPKYKKTAVLSPYQAAVQHNREPNLIDSTDEKIADRNQLRFSHVNLDDDDDDLEDEHRTMLRHDHHRHLHYLYNLRGKSHPPQHDENDNFYNYGSGGSDRIAWSKYLSFETYDGPIWTCVQLLWRLLLSVFAALLIFYILTKPPPPHVTIKVDKVKQFELGEGVDNSGVETKILTCNCSVELVIDNRSKLFGLNIGPPLLDISFGHLTFATSHGEKLEAISAHHTKPVNLNIEVAHKPMYGAGRSMQDMLDSARGLPLIIKLSLKTNFHLVGSLIKSKFHHEAKCLLVLHNSYDKNRTTQSYTSTCFVKRS